MTYAEKLRSPKWQKKRLEIMQRDGFSCQLCKDTESTLHVHHKEYRTGAQPWEYEDENFITYCSACHAIVEDLKTEEDVSGLISAKKMHNKEGVQTILVSFIQEGLSCVAAYLFAIPSEEIKHVVTLGNEAIDTINDLRQQAELTTLK